MAEKKNDVKFHEEIQKMEYEPMDETELKLIKGGITCDPVRREQIHPSRHPLILKHNGGRARLSPRVDTPPCLNTSLFITRE